MRYLYNLLFYIALPFIFLRLLLRSRRAPDYRRRWAERLGFCPHRLQKCIWVHAVSMGETIAAIPLIKALKAQYPDVPLLVTNMTPTGSARVKAAFGDTVLNAYIPYDFPGGVSRFLDRIHPKILVVMETELWPVLFAACKKRNIPIIVTNARLSEKSALGYQRIASITRDMLNTVCVLAAQTQADADRFIALGLPRDRIRITGNLKFDLELSSDLEAKGEALRQALGKDRWIWIAASTHPSEEEIMLAAHRMVLEKFPQALLILVPRHPERFDSVAAMAEQQGFSVVRRSSGLACRADTVIYLGDTMGEMMLMYSACDVACVAGSFAEVGGHNMLEPAVLHKPVITGPKLYNFAEISELLLTAGGMVKVNNAEELAAAVVRFFTDENDRRQTGDNAYRVVEMNRGALRRQLEEIKLCLSS